MDTFQNLKNRVSANKAKSQIDYICTFKKNNNPYIFYHIRKQYLQMV